MALYYPPKKGYKGWRPQHWPDNNIPVNLGEAIMAAKANNEAIYNSVNEWLILDDLGRPPSKVNMDYQPYAQLKQVNWYGVKATPIGPITVTASKEYTPGVLRNPNLANFLKPEFLIPMAVAAVIILMPQERK